MMALILLQDMLLILFFLLIYSVEFSNLLLKFKLKLLFLSNFDEEFPVLVEDCYYY